MSAPVRPLGSACALAAAVILLAAAGCAPSLATMQPASVAPKGHFQAAAGFEVGVPTGAIVTVIDTGKTLGNAAQNGSLTPDQERQVFEGGVTLVASPPSASPDVAIAYTPIDHFELGLRYAGSGWRVGARYQLLSHETAPMDLTVGAGVSRSATPIPAADFIPILEVDDFTRWTVDVPVLIGTSRDWFRVWMGPKLLWSRFTTALRLTIPGGDVELASFEGHATYIGGQGGFALGWKHLFLAIELTVAKVFGTASVSAATLAEIRPVDFSGFVIYPSFGVIAEF